MELTREIRLGFRALSRESGSAIAAILTLALGIGANVAMVSLASRLLVDPPPHLTDPKRIVRLELAFTDRSGERFTMSTTSYPVFHHLRAETRSFAALAAVATGTMVWGRAGDAQPVAALEVSGRYFGLLGGEPLIGRWFGDPEDEAPTGRPVVVLGHAFWRRAFGADPAIIGRRIVLDDVGYEVIGVAPPDFTGATAEPNDVWVPLSAAFASDQGWRDTPGRNLIALLGRLRPETSPSAAAAEGSRILGHNQDLFGGMDATASLEVNSLVPGLGDRSTIGRIALWLALVSAIAFAIAVANVANLMLVRAYRRRRELAVRAALGAGRVQLVRQLAIESLLLTAGAGLVALIVAVLASEAIRTVLVPSLAAPEGLVPRRLGWLTVLAAVAGGLLVGVMPAVRATRISVVDDLKAGGGGASRRRAPLLSAMLVVQSGLTVVLLVGAGLFLQSLHRVRAQDLGFDRRNVYLATMRFPGAVAGATADARYREAEQAVGRIPGVVLASVAQAVPFGNHHVPPIAVPGREDFPDPRQQLPFLNAATPAYFAILGLRLEEGRGFTEQDRRGSALVVVINRSMARGIWPGESPLGRCLKLGFAPGEEPHGVTASASLPCRTVVGVVNDARPRSIREETGQARMQYYVPFEQSPGPPDVVQPRPAEISSLLVRTNGDAQLPATVRRVMQSFAPDLPLTEVSPLQDLLDRQIRPWTLGAAVFTGLGLLAAGLAAIGLYAVRSYLVAQRTRELGVRQALGAGRREIAWLVLRDGLRVMGAGLGIGAAIALATTRFVAPLLFETSPRDPATLLGVAVMLGLVTLAASAIPAWRAASTRPTDALRAE
jgi:predicted permease